MAKVTKTGPDDRDEWTRAPKPRSEEEECLFPSRSTTRHCAMVRPRGVCWRTSIIPPPHRRCSCGWTTPPLDPATPLDNPAPNRTSWRPEVSSRMWRHTGPSRTPSVHPCQSRWERRWVAQTAHATRAHSDAHHHKRCNHDPMSSCLNPWVSSQTVGESE